MESVSQFSSSSVVSDLCGPKDCSTPGLPVHLQLLELAQTHVHRVGDGIQASNHFAADSMPVPCILSFPLSHPDLCPFTEFSSCWGFQAPHSALSVNGCTAHHKLFLSGFPSLNQSHFSAFSCRIVFSSQAPTSEVPSAAFRLRPRFLFLRVLRAFLRGLLVLDMGKSEATPSLLLVVIWVFFAWAPEKFFMI